jgi:hypothetical protein
MGEEPSSSKIKTAFNLIRTYKDVISLHQDDKNYIEARKSILGGYELKHSIDDNLFVSNLDCIKGEIIISTFYEYNSNKDNLIKKIKWKKLREYTFVKNIKNLSLILLLLLLIYLKINRELIEDFFLYFAGRGADPMLIIILIVLLIILASKKYLEFYKIIEGPKKIFATVPPLILLMLVIAWIISLEVF